jgi:hypothetical protein
VSKSFRDWISEGEGIYQEAMEEYKSLESQIAQLESRMAEKKTEVNQIAQMVGKPAVDGPKRVSAQLIEQGPPPPGTMGSVTRALTGRGIVARAQA